MPPAAPLPHGHFRILYFASAASYTKTPEDTFPAPLPVPDLFPFLDTKYPGMYQKVLRSCVVTVNMDYVDVDTGGRDSTASRVIQEGDEVSIIPPISAG